MIQYHGCGLDNVFLRNGYRLGRTDAGTDTLFIENVTALHRAIADWICDLPRKLTPKEFKFLRKELDLSQRQLGDMLQVKEGTVSTWERGTYEIDSLADVVLRALVKERISGNAAFEAVLQKLAKHESEQLWQEAERIEFEADPEWRHAA
jgi:putative transcriptional regulator